MLLRVKELREAKEWNQTVLAYHAGLSPSQVSLIETGKRNPTATTLKGIADALNVEIGDLFPKGTASSPNESEQRRRVTVHELRDKIQEMGLIEQRRRRDIDQWGSDDLGVTRVWEWEVFDQYLRGEFGGFIEKVNAGTEKESPNIQHLCLEFVDKLSTLESLSAQARAVAIEHDAKVYVGTEKSAHGLQKYLQGVRELEPEAKESR
jgi:transcriptional regulator with XRE-family HTH domain